MIELLRQIVSNHPLTFNILVIIASLVLLAKASSFLVLGISNYSKKLGISDYLIGLVVVSISSSVPEFLASLSGVFYTSSEIVFGTIFGSNFMGITLALAILAIAGKKVTIKEQVFQKTKWDVILLIALPFVLLADGKLGWIDGIVLVTAFVFYLIMLWKREGEFGRLKKKVKIKDIYKDGLIYSLSLVTVLLASQFLVQSSLKVSELMNIHPFLVASVLIGVGAQVPDLALGLHSISKGHHSVALGNLIGSMIVKSLIFLGIFALMTTLKFGLKDNIIMGAATLLTCLLLFRMVKKGVLTRANGVVLLLVYIIVLAVQAIFLL